MGGVTDKQQMVQIGKGNKKNVECGLAVPLLDTYPQERGKLYVHTRTYIQMFAAAFFITARKEQPNAHAPMTGKQTVAYPTMG